jgi:hypothetical protein
MDNTTKRGPADGSRINLREEHEVRYWTGKYGVTKEQLEAAVREVGVMAKDVEAKLKKS